MKHQLMTTLFKMVEAAEIAGKPSIAVEAGHFYANQELDAKVEAGALLGVSILGFLEEFGVETSAMIFIDDLVNKPEESSGPPNQIYIQAGLDKITNSGFKPESIIYESQLIPRGAEIISQLEQAGKTKAHSDRVMLKKGWVPLTGKNGDSTVPSCQALDAALYEQKLLNHGGAVTVLEKTYAGQQLQTRLVLESIGIVHPNVLVLLFAGENVEVEYWSDEK